MDSQMYNNSDRLRADANSDVGKTADDVKRAYDVKLAGLSIKLRSSHDEKTVRELVEFVDSKISEVTKSYSHLGFQNALLLASLNMAEEHLLLKKMAIAAIDRIESRTKFLLEQIEEA